jgi:hypothetical protein
MRNIRFDWRWVALIVFVAILAGAQSIPWPILALALAAGGGYVLYMGWQIWNGGSGGGFSRQPRVTYWRGQRIELTPERRRSMPSLRSITPALVYLIIGGALLLGAIALVWQHI